MANENFTADGGGGGGIPLGFIIRQLCGPPCHTIWQTPQSNEEGRGQIVFVLTVLKDDNAASIRPRPTCSQTKVHDCPWRPEKKRPLSSTLPLRKIPLPDQELATRLGPIFSLNPFCFELRLFKGEALFQSPFCPYFFLEEGPDVMMVYVDCD